ncbi:MAG: cell wall hydrolase [Pseudomonadota bacterium]
MYLFQSWAAALFFVLFSTVSAASDAMLSTSNDPRGVVDPGFAELLILERSGYSEEDVERVSAFLNAPVLSVSALQGFDASVLKLMPAASGGAEWECLAEALYFEARGEGLMGQFAVGEVILNRVASIGFPDTVCGVVQQGTGRGKYKCQFTYNCDGQAEVFNEQLAYERVAKVARILLDGADRRLTSGATHYHTKHVSPRWAKTFDQTAIIGVHHFYRAPASS